MSENKEKAYRDAWTELRLKLDTKTGWGRVELKVLMDRILIECMEKYL